MKILIKGGTTAILGAVVAMLIGFSHIAHADAPSVQIPSDVKGQIAFYAGVYGYDASTLLSVARCESGFDQKNRGDNGLSIGVFSIQAPTWKRFTKEMGETLDRNSSRDQSKVAAWAFANGHAREWTTYRSLKNGGTYSFYSRQLKKHFTVKCST